MQQQRRQGASATLSLFEKVQVIADGRAADVPVEGVQDGDLGKLQLRGADVEERSVLAHVGHRAVDHELEALWQKKVRT